MAGGRWLSVPKGLSVRPTPDLVRQAVFNSLGPRVEGAAVLDLFSGSGALGLECLSRGAESVVSVELSSRHARFVRANAERLALPVDRLEIRTQDAFGALRQLVVASRCFDLIIADPPFGPKTRGERSQSLSQQLIDVPETGVVLKDDGLLVLGHARRDALTIPPAWCEVKELAHGDSVFQFFQRAAPSPEVGT
jgi:16S rRNA (guanine966-N2)-methyltransferase